MGTKTKINSQLFQEEYDKILTKLAQNYESRLGLLYIGMKQNVQTEFFLNGVSYGDIEEVFKDLNRSLDLINELGATEE